MAHIFQAPASVGAPPDLAGYFRGVRFDHAAYDAAQGAWLAALHAWAKETGQGELAGVEVAWPRGDGSARYLVWKERPLQLIHLPLGDAWQHPQIERLRLADVRERVRQQEGLRRLFGKKEDR